MRSHLLHIFLLFIPGVIFSQQFIPDTVGCSPFVIPLNSPITTYDSLIWDFGNGAYSNHENPTALYPQAGEYIVNLYVDQGTGQFDTITNVISIQVVEQPMANFTLNQQGNCKENVFVQFQNNSTNYDSLLWDFGDGNQSNDISPQHVYSNYGTFFPVLTITNNYGCQNQFSLDSVLVDPLPVFQLSTSVLSSCSQADSLSLMITGSFSSFQVEIAGQLYNSSPIEILDFGGPNDSIQVWGANQFGCVDTVYFSNVFSGNSTSDFTFDLNDANICLNQQAIIEVNSSVSNIDSIHWLVDGVLTSDSTVFLYTSNSSQAQNLVAEIYLGSGCVAIIDTVLTPISSSIYQGTIQMDSVVCANEVVPLTLSNNQYDHIEWYMNSLMVSINDTLLFSSDQAYFQLIQAAVYDTNQCMTILTDSVYIPLLVADIFFFNSTGCAPLTTTFMNVGAGGDQYYWDFGDGNTGVGTPIQHTYSDGGFYSVQLVSESTTYGCYDTLFLEDQIKVYSDDVNFDTLTIEACGSYQLDIQNFNIGTGFWEWNYGDGTTSNGQNASHLYDTPGVYTVSLSTNSASGCQTFIDGVAEITIKAQEAPQIEFSLNCPEAYVYLNGSSSSNIEWALNGLTKPMGDTLEIFAWDFASGNVLVSFSYTDSVGCLVDEDVYLMLNCPDSSGISSPMVSDPNDPGIPIPDTITICIDEGIGFGFIQLPPDYNLVSFSAVPGENLPQLPSLYHFDNGGIYQPTFIVNGPLGIDTLTLNRVYRVIDYQPSFNVSVGPYSCDSLYLVFKDSINVSDFVYWEVTGVGNWNSNDLQVAIPNDNFNIHVSYKLIDTLGCGMELDQTFSYSKMEFQANFSDQICFGDGANYFTDIATSSYPHHWDFGDGNTSTTGSGFHQYSNDGVFFPILIVDDLFGCVDTVHFDSISVWNPENQILGLSTYICMLDSVSISAANPDFNLSWYLNGSPRGTGPSFDFIPQFSSISVSNTIQLVSETHGCVHSVVDTVVSYSPQFSTTANQDRKCLPAQVTMSVVTDPLHQIEWIPQAGGNSILADLPDTTYTMNDLNDWVYGLRVSDSLGCSRSVHYSSFKLWNQDYSYSVSEGCSPLAVEFVPPANAVQYSWEFDPQIGSVITDSIANVVFIDTGYYHLSASFTMDDNCVLNFNDSNIVLVHSIYADPSVAVLNNCIPAHTQFSLDSVYNVDYLNWNYGDGANSSVANSDHIYINGGVFYPELYVSSNEGCIDTIIFTDSVFVGGGDPQFSITDSILCAGSSTDFILDNGQLYSSYQWVLGDGSVYDVSSFPHTFDFSGNYSVLIYATDTLGCVSNSINPTGVEGIGIPNFDFSLNDSIYCLGENLSINIDNPDSNTISWELNGQPFDINDPLDSSGTNILIGSASLASCSFQIADTFEAVVVPLISLLSDSIFCVSSNPVILQTDVSNGVWSGNIIIDSLSGEIDIQNALTDTVYYSVNGNCNINSEFIIRIDSSISSEFTFEDEHCAGNVNLNLNPLNSNGVWFMDGQNLNIIDLNTLGSGDYQIVHSVQNGVCLDQDTGIVTIHVVPQINMALSDSIFCFNQEIEVYSSNPLNYTINMYAVDANGDSIQGLSNLSNTPGAYDLYYSVEDTNQCASDYLIGGVIVLDPSTPNQVNVIRSTVVGDQFVYTEWTIDNADLIKIEDLTILRTIRNEANWMQIDQVPKSYNFYEDYSAQVNEFAYEYQIKPNYHCTWDVLPSESNTIYLKIEDDGGFKKLKWNAYEKWDTGVDHYEVQVLINGQWQTIQILAPNILELIDP